MNVTEWLLLTTVKSPIALGNSIPEYANRITQGDKKMLAIDALPGTTNPESYNFQNQAELLESLIAEINQALAEHRAAEAARDILARLVHATEHAFAREENLMEASGYSGLDAHRQQHRELSHQLGSFVQRAPKSNGAIGFELKIFLKAWLAQHIHETDQMFLAYVSTLGGEDDASEADRPWWKVW